MKKNYPGMTPYAYAMNRTIDGIDLDGGEWKSQHNWSDKLNGRTYSSMWEEHLGKTLNNHLQSGTKADCADIVIATFIEFAAMYKLPFHVEGSNTGGLRLYDNDLMAYKTTEQLVAAVQHDYGASDFYNGLPALKEKKIDEVGAGDILTWKWNGGGNHAQGIVKREGNEITSIYGNLDANNQATPLETGTYNMDNVKNGTPLGFVYGLLGARGSARAYTWDFSYMDRFVNYNSQADRNAKYEQIFTRVLSEVKDYLSMDQNTTYRQLDHNWRSVVRSMTQDELDTGKRINYTYRTVDWNGKNSGGDWDE